MNGRDVVHLVSLSAPRRPIVTKHAHRTSGVPLRVNCSCATRKQLRGPLLSVKNASPCADLELATHRGSFVTAALEVENQQALSRRISSLRPDYYTANPRLLAVVMARPADGDRLELPF